MSFTACPIATVHAPVEQVWQLLADPSQYALWWDARTVSIMPEGPAQTGQQIFAHTTALGHEWAVHLTVQRVEPGTRQLDLLTQLPLGITVHNHIVCTSLDQQQTRVSFG
jgi:ligand-binding SRPBCC domain-containing protein